MQFLLTVPNNVKNGTLFKIFTNCVVFVQQSHIKLENLKIVSHLGVNPQCSFDDFKTLRIQLGQSASIMNDDMIIVKPENALGIAIKVFGGVYVSVFFIFFVFVFVCSANTDAGSFALHVSQNIVASAPRGA